MAKRALLCGCNYPGSQHALNGCVNDVRAMQRMLREHYGFSDTDITILIDTDSNYEQPTGANIKVSFNETAEQLPRLSTFGTCLILTQIPELGPINWCLSLQLDAACVSCLFTSTPALDKLYIQTHSQRHTVGLPPAWSRC